MTREQDAREAAGAVSALIDAAVRDFRTVYPEPHALAPNLALAVQAQNVLRAFAALLPAPPATTAPDFEATTPQSVALRGLSYDPPPATTGRIRLDGAGFPYAVPAASPPATDGDAADECPTCGGIHAHHGDCHGEGKPYAPPATDGAAQVWDQVGGREVRPKYADDEEPSSGGGAAHTTERFPIRHARALDGQLADCPDCNASPPATTGRAEGWRCYEGCSYCEAASLESDPSGLRMAALLRLVESWDGADEDDNYSRGQAATDARAAMDAACTCKALPHDRRCPQRSPAPSPPATTGAGEAWLPRAVHTERPITVEILASPPATDGDAAARCSTCGQPMDAPPCSLNRDIGWSGHTIAGGVALAAPRDTETETR